MSKKWNGQIPAQAARIAFPDANWKELIEDGYHKSAITLST